jgi:hypothetical protein
MTGGTISNTVYSTVTLGADGYASPLTITASGYVEAGEGMLGVSAGEAGTILNYGRIAGGQSAYQAGDGVDVVHATMINGGEIRGGPAVLLALGGGMYAVGTAGVGVELSGGAVSDLAAGVVQGGNGPTLEAVPLTAAGTGAEVDAGTFSVSGQVLGGEGGRTGAGYGGYYASVGAGGLGVDITGGRVSILSGGRITGGQGGYIDPYDFPIRYSGADGGDGAHMSAGKLSIAGTLTGGAGSDVRGSRLDRANQDGTGGVGLVLDGGGASLVSGGTIAGGRGGETPISSDTFDIGGRGGVAAVINGGVLYANGVIQGGEGLIGGLKGGGGGDGVDLTAGLLSIGATGTVAGGAGGYTVLTKYQGGPGGFGVSFTGGTFYNAGLIVGGGGGISRYSYGDSGGTGLYVGAAVTSLTVGGVVRGGASSGSFYPHGHSAGAAIVLGGQTSITVTGTAQGGAGVAGLTPHDTFALGGNGVDLERGDLSLTATGVILGGSGYHEAGGVGIYLDGGVADIGGEVQGGAGAVGIDLAAGTVDIAFTGMVQGVYAIGPATLISYGALSAVSGAAVRFRSAADRLVLEAKSTLAGTAAGGGGTLELAGGAGDGTLSGLGGSISGFAAYVVDAGAAWSLAGTDIIGAGETLADDGSLSLAGTLIDFGAIITTGATSARLESAAARLIIEGGSTIAGTVAGAGGVLEMAAAAGAGTTSGLGTTLTGFASYVVDPGASWRLTGTNSVAAGRTIVDYGALTVAGSLTAHGGVTLEPGSHLTNESGALVKSGVGVYAASGADVTNYGVIQGSGGTAVQFTSAGRLIDEGGARFIGDVIGAGGELELAAAGGTGTISGLGTNFTGFASYYVDFPGVASWVLAGANTLGAGQTLGVGGSLTVTGSLTDVNGLYAGSGSIFNLGTIVTAGGPGVNVAGGGVVNGSATAHGALLEGVVGAYSAHLGTVVNNGTIEGTSGVAVKFTSESALLVMEAGSRLIGSAEGGGGVLEVGPGAWTLTGLGGAGMLGGSGSGAFSGFGSYIIPSGASISMTGANTLAAGQYLSNYGAFSGTLTLGSASAAFVAGAGSTSARVVGDGGTVIAEGTIDVTGLGAIGTISGGLSMTFSGFGTYDGRDGFGSDGSTWTLVGTNTLAAGKSITGVGTLDLAGALENAGLITGQGAALYLSSTGSLTNAGGTIGGDVGTAGTYSQHFGGYGGAGSIGVILTGAGSITNLSGTIAGGAGGHGGNSTNVFHGSPGWGYGGPGGAGAAGIFLEAGGTITNGGGTILGGAGGAGGTGDYPGRSGAAGVAIGIAAGGLVTNGGAGVASALICGSVGVYALGGSSATISNYGTIEGTGGRAVQLSAAADRLIVHAGAVFLGGVAADGGTLELASGNGTITGLGAAAALSGAVTMSFGGFGTYVVDAGAVLTLAGDDALRAGGVLDIAGALTLSGTLDNAGVIAGSAGSKIVLKKADIVGGTLSSAGAVSVKDNGCVFDGTGATLTNQATITIADAAALTIQGAIADDGRIVLSGKTAATRLIIGASGATLDGGGSLALTASAFNTITGASATAMLTNVDDTISGGGMIGSGKMDFVNDAAGLIEQIGAVALTIDTKSQTIVNAGTIAAAGPGGLTIASAVANSGILEVEKGVLTLEGNVTGAERR